MTESFEIRELRRKFYGYYQNKIAKDLDSFEEVKQIEFFKYCVCLLLLILTVIIGIFVFIHFMNTMPSELFWGSGSRDHGYSEVIYMVTGLIAGGFWFLARKVNKNFENRVKADVIGSFLSFFGDFTWSPDLKIEKYELEESKLFGGITKIDPDDYFQGTYKGLNIIISEVEIERGTGKQRVDVFGGVLVKLDMNKRVLSHTIVTEDVSWSKFSKYFLPTAFSNMDKTELEDVEFNKMFNVYTEDEVEARYILTTSFMERLKILKETYKADDIRASFKDNSLLIALCVSKDMFVLGDVRKPVRDAGEVQTLFDQFASVLSIVDLLKLDVKTGL